MLNYVAGYMLTYLIFQSESYWRDTEGFNAAVFPTSKDLPELGDLAALDDRRAGRDRDPARADHRVRDRRRAVGALQPDALRVRGAGAERLRAGRALRRDQRAAEDPRGDGDLGRDRRPRRREPGRRLQPLPRRRPERPAEARLRLHGDRRRGARPLQPVRRAPRRVPDRRARERGQHAPGGRLPGRARRGAPGDHPLLRARRRALHPQPRAARSPGSDRRHAGGRTPHESQPARRRDRLGDRLRDAAPVRVARRAAGGALGGAEPRRRGDDARRRRDRVLEHRADPRDELGRTRDRRRARGDRRRGDGVDPRVPRDHACARARSSPGSR